MPALTLLHLLLVYLLSFLSCSCFGLHIFLSPLQLVHQLFAMETIVGHARLISMRVLFSRPRSPKNMLILLLDQPPHPHLLLSIKLLLLAPVAMWYLDIIMVVIIVIITLNLGPLLHHLQSKVAIKFVWSHLPQPLLVHLVDVCSLRKSNFF